MAHLVLETLGSALAMNLKPSTPSRFPPEPLNDKSTPFSPVLTFNQDKEKRRLHGNQVEEYSRDSTNLSLRLLSPKH